MVNPAGKDMLDATLLAKEGLSVTETYNSRWFLRKKCVKIEIDRILDQNKILKSVRLKKNYGCPKTFKFDRIKRKFSQLKAKVFV